MRDAFGTITFATCWNGAYVAALLGARHFGAGWPLAWLAGGVAAFVVITGLNAFGATHHSHKIGRQGDG